MKDGCSFRLVFYLDDQLWEYGGEDFGLSTELYQPPCRSMPPLK